jgi:hypothetical protein
MDSSKNNSAQQQLYDVWCCVEEKGWNSTSNLDFVSVAKKMSFFAQDCPCVQRLFDAAFKCAAFLVGLGMNLQIRPMTGPYSAMAIIIDMVQGGPAQMGGLRLGDGYACQPNAAKNELAKKKTYTPHPLLFVLDGACT